MLLVRVMVIKATITTMATMVIIELMPSNERFNYPPLL